jgi:hypothetical protein
MSIKLNQQFGKVLFLKKVSLGVMLVKIILACLIGCTYYFAPQYLTEMFSLSLVIVLLLPNGIENEVLSQRILLECYCRTKEFQDIARSIQYLENKIDSTDREHY